MGCFILCFAENASDYYGYSDMKITKQATILAMYFRISWGFFLMRSFMGQGGWEMLHLEFTLEKTSCVDECSPTNEAFLLRMQLHKKQLPNEARARLQPNRPP